MDKLTFLLMNNLVSDRTLSYIKTVTICAGYDVARVLPDEDAKATSTSLQKQFLNRANAWACFDTAILDIYAHYPRVDETKLELYTQLFADTDRLQTWLNKLEQAEMSIQETNMFTSTFLRGRRLKVGSKQNTRGSIDVKHVSSRKKSSSFDYANALATNGFSFAEFIAAKLLHFPNVRVLGIDAHSNLPGPKNAATLYSSRAEWLLSKIANVLPQLPKLEVRLHLHGRLLHKSFLSAIIGDLSQIKLVRFECYNNCDHYRHGASFMRTLKARTGVKRLEIDTRNDPSNSNPIPDRTQRDHICDLALKFLIEVEALPDGGTATEIALCSQFLTSRFNAIPCLNAHYEDAQYIMDFDDKSELDFLLSMFKHKGAAVRKITIASRKRQELDLPLDTPIGLVKLTALGLCNVFLSPQLKKRLQMLKPGLRMEQVNW